MVKSKSMKNSSPSTSSQKLTPHKGKAANSSRNLVMCRTRRSRSRARGRHRPDRRKVEQIGSFKVSCASAECGAGRRASKLVIACPWRCSKAVADVQAPASYATNLPRWPPPALPFAVGGLRLGRRGDQVKPEPIGQRAADQIEVGAVLGEIAHVFHVAAGKPFISGKASRRSRASRSMTLPQPCRACRSQNVPANLPVERINSRIRSQRHADGLPSRGS